MVGTYSRHAYTVGRLIEATVNNLELLLGKRLELSKLPFDSRNSGYWILTLFEKHYLI